MTSTEPPSRPFTPRPPRRPSLRAIIPALLLLSLAALKAQPQAPPTAQPSPWHLAWSDEFNAPAGTPPDPAKWTFDLGGNGYGNHELETYTSRPANIQQQGGSLVITARKEDVTGPDGTPRHYTSARIKTQAHFAQAYGRFEARMQLPAGKGIWPAFWLLGDSIGTVGWPGAGEIDILEAIGDPSTIYSTLHGPGYSGGHALSARFPLPQARPSIPASTPTPSSGLRTTSGSSSTTTSSPIAPRPICPPAPTGSTITPSSSS